ncbi:MAG: 2-amino-4-hydroxy-6-hydroxymethyldihydropteridine diphosphokinase [Vicinamibacterales bacterium]
MPAAGRPAGGTRVAIALGSNLGDRAAHLQWALLQLRAVIRGLEASPFEETAPVEVSDVQPDYLNAVAVGRTSLAPEALLDVLLGLETARGRVRPGPRAARTLDLDLVLYGDRVIDTPRLRVPHPRFADRPFVLGPLARLAPRWRDPRSGLSLAALWRRQRPAGVPQGRPSKP